MKILAKYMAQGALQREDYEDNEEQEEDPIFRLWVFKKVAAVSELGLDAM